MVDQAGLPVLRDEAAHPVLRDVVDPFDPGVLVGGTVRTRADWLEGILDNAVAVVADNYCQVVEGHIVHVEGDNFD